MHAIKCARIDMAARLVQQCAGKMDTQHRTALQMAATRNIPELVRILAPLEHGMRNKNGLTAAMAA